LYLFISDSAQLHVWIYNKHISKSIIISKKQLLIIRICIKNQNKKMRLSCWKEKP
jgi:hypothetical protein